MSRTAKRDGDDPMSLAPPEADGPLRRERLRTARLYFVCDARPRGGEPEPLLHAALTRRRRHRPAAGEGARRGEIDRARRRTFRRLCDTHSALFIVNDDPDLAAPATPTGSTSARTTCRPPRRASCSGRTRSSASRPTPRSRWRRRAEPPVDYVSVGPDLGDADESRGGPAVGLGLRRARRGQRPPSLLRDRRHRPDERRRRSSPPAPAGSASCGRSATPRTRPPRPKRCAARWRRSERRAPGG